jgi:hypothetical protein
VLLAIALVAACNRIEIRPVKDPRAAIPDAEGLVCEDLPEDGAAEARSWLRRQGSVVFEADLERVEDLVEGLYADGATRVWFTRIRRLDSPEFSASIAVELPSDPAARQALLATEARFWDEEHSTPDFGQRYAYFTIR